MKAIIVGASPEAYWDARWTPELVVCADGGLRTARALGLRPDILIGDGDSGGRAKDVPTVCLPTEKEESDLQACARYVVERGASELVLLGVTGGRLDHFIANVGLLGRLGREGVNALILNEGNEIGLYREPLRWEPPHPYRYFSLLPLDAFCEGVTLEGAKYPLRNATLYRDDSRGLSNEPSAADKAVRVTVRAGACLLVRSK